MFFTDLSLLNFAHNTDTKFMFTLESNLNKLFESTDQGAAIPRNPDAQVIFYDHLYIHYQQIVLEDNFLAYVNTSLRAKTALRTGVFNAL